MKYKLLKRVYDKSVILFTVIWIVLYCVLFSLGDYLSSLIGIEKIITLPIGIVLSFILIDFLCKNKLLSYYGFKKSDVSIKSMLFYIPLIFLLGVNVWKGVTLNFTILETVFYILSMFIVGLLEEVIFRGLLFNEMKKSGLVSAIIVSSVTFGIGHIINLFNGSNVDLINNLLQVVYAIGAGFMFVMIYLKSDSLIVCILTHGLFNALSAFDIPTNNIKINIIESLVITLISVGYGIYLLISLKKKNNVV